MEFAQILQEITGVGKFIPPQPTYTSDAPQDRVNKAYGINCLRGTRVTRQNTVQQFTQLLKLVSCAIFLFDAALCSVAKTECSNFRQISDVRRKGVEEPWSVEYNTPIKYFKDKMS